MAATIQKARSQLICKQAASRMGVADGECVYSHTFVICAENTNEHLLIESDFEQSLEPTISIIQS
jgi:hypothetical protein